MRFWRDRLARLGARIATGRDALVAAVLALPRLILFGLAALTGGRLPVLVVASNVASLADVATIGLRRRAPRAALALSTAVVLASAALPQRHVVTGFGVFVCAYTVASLLPWRAAAAALALCGAVHATGGVLAVMAGHDLTRLPTFWSRSDLLTVVLATVGNLAAAGLLGAYVQTRRAYTAQLVSGADERARSAVIEERGRIARELHDLAAHDLSAIVVQAGAADRLVDRDPGAAKDTLQAIRAQGRDTLSALRQLVGVLRDTDTDGRAPQPSLLRLDGLVEGAREAGMAVRLTTSGRPGSLPAALDLTAYRVVQEALTNARRHAPGAAVSITITYGDGVRVLVRNAAPPAPAGAPAGRGGHGLLGMRERVQQAGGTLTVGPTGDGGWQVDARLPG
jgi:signal transduction histidine kinase